MISLIDAIGRRLFFSIDPFIIQHMSSEVSTVEIRGILPANNGCAIFLGNDQKTFVIQVEHNMGVIIGMAIRETRKERPLTHDLMHNVFLGFGLTLERVVINELRGSTYLARILLKQENELGKKLVEIDARPSDCIAMACLERAPIFVSNHLLNQVEDMSEMLRKIQEKELSGSDDLDEL